MALFIYASSYSFFRANKPFEIELQGLPCSRTPINSRAHDACWFLRIHYAALNPIGMQLDGGAFACYHHHGCGRMQAGQGTHAAARELWLAGSATLCLHPRVVTTIGYLSQSMVTLHTSRTQLCSANQAFRPCPSCNSPTKSPSAMTHVQPAYQQRPARGSCLAHPRTQVHKPAMNGSLFGSSTTMYTANPAMHAA